MNPRSTQISQWTEDDVVTWATETLDLAYPTLSQDCAQKLRGQHFNGVALLTFSKEDLFLFGIPGGPALVLFAALQALSNKGSPAKSTHLTRISDPTSTWDWRASGGLHFQKQLDAMDDLGRPRSTCVGFPISANCKLTHFYSIISKIQGNLYESFL